MKTAEKTKTIVTGVMDVARNGTSRNGNPIYKVVTLDGTWNTATDSQLSYAATNFRPKYARLSNGGDGVILKNVRVTLEKARKNYYIIGMEEA